MYALAPIRPLLAQDASGHRFVACFLDGGWDVLLAADPRDPAGTYEGIDLGLESAGTGVPGPASRVDGRDRASVGAHDARPRTARRPRDLLSRHQHEHRLARHGEVLQPHGPPARRNALARGDSIGTVAASVHDKGSLLPNAAISVPSFNRGFDNRFSAIRMNDPREIQRPDRTHAQRAPRGCRGPSPPGARGRLLMRVAGLQRPATRGRAAHQPRPDPNGSSSRMSSRASTSTPTLRRWRNSRALPAQQRHRALGRDRCAAAADRAQRRRHHPRARRLRHPWRRVGRRSATAARSKPSTRSARFITHLRGDDPSFERTTVMVYSEFARTPKINGDGGRDHWFADTVMVFGSTFKTGVFGASNEQDLGPHLGRPGRRAAPMRPAFGFRPEHVMATLVQSLGGDPIALSGGPADRVDRKGADAMSRHPHRRPRDVSTWPRPSSSAACSASLRGGPVARDLRARRAPRQVPILAAAHPGPVWPHSNGRGV